MIQIQRARLEDAGSVYQIQKEGFRDLYETYQDAHSPYMESRESLLGKMYAL